MVMDIDFREAAHLVVKVRDHADTQPSLTILVGMVEAVLPDDWGWSLTCWRIEGGGIGYVAAAYLLEDMEHVQRRTDLFAQAEWAVEHLYYELRDL